MSLRAHHSFNLTTAAIYAKAAIAIPFVLNGHWALWRVGRPGGNATDGYTTA